jgi:hypothetical protein
MRSEKLALENNNRRLEGREEKGLEKKAARANKGVEEPRQGRGGDVQSGASTTEQSKPIVEQKQRTAAAAAATTSARKRAGSRSRSRVP